MANGGRSVALPTRTSLLIAAVLAVVTLLAAGCASSDGTDATGANLVDPSGPSGDTDASDTSGNADATGESSSGSLKTLDVPPLRLRQVTVLDRPLALTARPGSDDVFIAEQGGKVRRLSPDPDDDTTYLVDTQPVLDVSSQTEAKGEQGLLGLAFSPDGRRLFVHYTNLDGNTVVAAYTMDNTGRGVRADPSSRVEIFTVDQPAANHNGGQLAFGPDGYLYIGLGDGGGAGDPNNLAQDPTSVLGAVLRIDPDGADPDAGNNGSTAYAIPAGNPFATNGADATDATDATDGADEVWLFGVRNPWRFSFDRQTGDLWLGDVGQSTMEEVNLLPADTRAGRGANLGWSLFEGTSAHSDDAEDIDDQLRQSLVWPIYEYTHDDGCSVIGGYVYRGSAIEGLDGTYLFGDYCRPAIRGLRVDAGRAVAEGPVGIDVDNLSAFGQDSQGELWVMSLDGGVWRILPA
jgi:glucose/arabinose dehydrogenase